MNVFRASAIDAEPFLNFYDEFDAEDEEQDQHELVDIYEENTIFD